MDIVIGLIGQKLTGKDTVAQHLADRYGAVSFVVSHVLDDVLKTLALDVSREHEMQLAVALRGVFGETVLNTAVLKRLEQHPTGMRLINGIRRPDEARQALQSGVRLVYVTASVEERYRRYLQRNEKKDDGVLSLAAFVEQDVTSPTEKDIPSLQALCEYTIVNDSGVDALRARIEECIEHLNNS